VTLVTDESDKGGGPGGFTAIKTAGGFTAIKTAGGFTAINTVKSEQGGFTVVSKNGLVGIMRTSCSKAGEEVVNGKCQPKAVVGVADAGLSTGKKVAVGVVVAAGLFAIYRLATGQPLVPEMNKKTEEESPQ
jgi:hypothetical protein